MPGSRAGKRLLSGRVSSDTPGHKPWKILQSLAGYVTTLPMPNCFRGFCTTTRESLGDFHSPRGHVQQSDKSWPCLWDMTGAMQGIPFVHHKRFTCIFLRGKCAPRECLGECSLALKERAAFEETWVTLYSPRARHPWRILSRSSHAPPGR